MKRFVLKVLFFALGMMVILGIVDWCVSKHFYASKSVVLGPWNDIIQGRAEADLVVMGNSRAYCHFSPAILDSVLGSHSYVLGVSGRPVNSQVAMYNLFRYYYPKPKLIVYNVDISTITPKVRTGEVRYFPYFWNPAVRRIVLPEEHFSFAEKYLPLYRYYKLGFRHVADRNRECYRGYHASDKHYVEGKGIPKDMMVSIADSSNHQDDVLDDFVRKSISEGVEVVFVYTPYYCEAERLIGQDPWGRRYIEPIASKYNIKVFDYSRDSISFDTAYFESPTHMNRFGAEYISRRLADDLNAYYYKRSR